MPLKIFIAGTDTNVGKTFVSVGLLKAFNQLGYTTLGLKPIASGCQLIEGKLRSEDALALQQVSSFKLNYELINPFAFEPPIAPHIAAKVRGASLELKNLLTKIEPTLVMPADVKIMEGVGGWHVPLNSHQTMAELVNSLGLSVILVIGIKLGCLNHSILTAQAIANAKLPFLGWIANCMNPHAIEIHENITTLKQWLPAPHLGTIYYQQESGEVFPGIARQIGYDRS